MIAIPPLDFQQHLIDNETRFCAADARTAIESQIQWHKDYGPNAKYVGLLQYTADLVEEVLLKRIELRKGGPQ